MQWLFELFDKNTKNQGWWLKITNIQQLMLLSNSENGLLQTQYKHAFENYLKDKEFNPFSVEHGPHIKEAGLTYYLALVSQNKKTPFIPILEQTIKERIKNMTQILSEYGYVHINKNGGFCAHEKKADAFLYKKDMSFPEFTENNIHVKQFPGGKHYYAYIGNMQVTDKDIRKWNTYEEAYEQAKAYLITK